MRVGARTDSRASRYGGKNMPADLSKVLMRFPMDSEIAVYPSPEIRWSGTAVVENAFAAGIYCSKHEAHVV